MIMKRLLLLTSVYLTVLISFMAMPLVSSPAFASPESDICNGVGTTGGGSGCSGGSGPSLGGIIDATINILSIVVGIAAVIMIILGGFRYITSGGDSGKVAGAKDTIIYALVGIVVVAFAQAIVKFVLHGVGVL
jgi:hypothetical protein